MGFPSERRGHKRFDMTEREGKLALVRETAGGVEQEDCTLLNLSYGGMCFRARRLVQEGEQCRFFIDLPSPLRGSLLVKAQIRWVRPFEPESWNSGAEFLESSRGWLGPEENGGA